MKEEGQREKVGERERKKERDYEKEPENQVSTLCVLWKRERCNSERQRGPLSLPPRGKIKIKIRGGGKGGANQNKTKPGMCVLSRNEESREDRKGVCTEFH